jgi:hypothetical protein
VLRVSGGRGDLARSRPCLDGSSDMGIFAEYQEVYAAHRIATFPVNGKEKKPAVKHPQSFGLTASKQLASQFPDADCFGFWAGARSGVTVLDVDCSDESYMLTCLRRFGDTPLIVQTPSRKGFHLYYRHQGERRRIHPAGEPFDILGGGLVIAAPSTNEKGEYRAIRGRFGDLSALPTANWSDIPPATVATRKVGVGQRNESLFRFCLEHASNTTVEDLHGRAVEFNVHVLKPSLSCEEVRKTVEQAIAYTARGINFVSKPHVRVANDVVQRLAGPEPDTLSLLLFLRSHHWNGDFMIANALHKSLGWTLPRFRKARTALIDQNFVVCISPDGRYMPALYRWPDLPVRGT